MTSPLSNEVEQALADFERQKAAIGEIGASLAGAYSTVTAKNRAVAVTVDSQGVVTDVKFPTSAYRSMSGAELGDLLVGTIESARRKALAKTAAAFESVLPAGMPMLDLLTGGDGTAGRMPLDKLLAEVIRGDEPGGSGEPVERNGGV
jgi:DNA-binding protein YbaB